MGLLVEHINKSFAGFCVITDLPQACQHCDEIVR
jgi:hypothetical protein